MRATVRPAGDRPEGDRPVATAGQDEIPTVADILRTTVLVVAVPLLVLRVLVWVLTGA